MNEAIEINFKQLRNRAMQMISNYYCDRVLPIPQKLMELLSSFPPSEINSIDSIAFGNLACFLVNLYVCEEGYEHIFEHFLKCGGSIKLSDISVLSMASENAKIKNLLEKIKNILTGGVNDPLPDLIYNSRCQKGCTFLHHLAYSHNYNEVLLKFIMGLNADVNATDENKDTALHIALRENNFKFIEALLLCTSPNIDLPNNMGKTIRTLATEKYKERISIIKSADLLLSSSKGEKLEVTADNFKLAVASFEKRHGLTSISDVFINEKPSKNPLLSLFFADKQITDYLARPIIEFNENNAPQYNELEILIYTAIMNETTSAHNKQNSDLKQNKIIEIPYRTYTNNSSCMFKSAKDKLNDFYLQGTIRKTTKLQIANIKRHFLGHENPHLKLIYPLDIRDLSAQLLHMSYQEKLQGNDRGFLYIISATTRDSHILVTLSLVNVNTKKLCGHIVINSWSNQKYFMLIKSRIEGYLDDVKTMASIVDDGTLFYKREPFEHHPFCLDGSLDIQMNEDDKNCAIYTQAICCALYQALEGDDNLQKRLEILFSSHNPLEDSDIISLAWKKLLPIFHQAIQKKLPQFFKLNENEGYELKPYEEVKEYHKQFRWDCGNQYIKQKSAKHLERLTNELHVWENLEQVFSLKYCSP